MSTLCEKEYVLTLGSNPPSPSAYWKMEEASGNRADSIGTQSFIPSIDKGNTTGKIGNGLYFPGGLPSVAQFDLDYTVNPIIAYDPSGPGLSVAFWWKPLALDATFGSDLTIYFGSYGVVLWHRLYKDRYYLQFQGTITDSTIDMAYPWIAGQWYFIVAQFRTSTNKVRFCVNAGAWTEASSTASGSGPFFPTYGAINVGFGLPVNAVLDELGLWMNIILSDADVLSIYNNGAGRTFP